MKAEKTQLEKVSRTIQQTGGGGRAQFVDNRPSAFVRSIPEQLVQRMGSEDEEEALQRPNTTGLPDHVKAGVEDIYGVSLDDVHVEYNSDKPAAVQAKAYTQGTNIFVAPGQEATVPHEACHVPQQLMNRVEPTTEINGLPVNNSIALEREADVNGEKANAFKY